LDFLQEGLVGAEEEGAGLLGLVSHCTVLSGLQQAIITTNQHIFKLLLKIKVMRCC